MEDLLKKRTEDFRSFHRFVDGDEDLLTGFEGFVRMDTNSHLLLQFALDLNFLERCMDFVQKKPKISVAMSAGFD